jgi:hypothetical protein
MEDKEKKVTVNFKMGAEEYASIKRIAEAHKRSFASYVRDVLMAEDIKRHARGAQGKLDV